MGLQESASLRLMSKAQIDQSGDANNLQYVI